MPPTLVLPSVLYKESYIQAVKAFKTEGIERYTPLDPVWLENHFEEFIQTLSDNSQGKNLQPGRVQHTEFWLATDTEFLGRLDIRHELNDVLYKVGGHIGYDIRKDQRGKGYGHLILKLGLEKAKELGMENILITCDVGNLPSQKVILGAGGVLENTVENKNRYWIKV